MLRLVENMFCHFPRIPLGMRSANRTWWHSYGMPTREKALFLPSGTSLTGCVPFASFAALTCGSWKSRSCLPHLFSYLLRMVRRCPSTRNWTMMSSKIIRVIGYPDFVLSSCRNSVAGHGFK